MSKPATIGDTPPAPGRHTILAYKGTKDFADWLNALADAAGFPVCVTVDQALRDYAVKLNHPAPMPRRIPRRVPRAARQATA